ncbi:MAG: serine/threonine-protein phosphatase [Synergistaceae bacterium]|nr:serine/threonine-protein phosphatase [Synergistaceae bacterium]
MRFAYSTNRGAVRAENQDSLCLAEEVITGDMASADIGGSDDIPMLLAVIDGMGGYGGGELASRILAETFALASSRKIFASSGDPVSDERKLLDILNEASSLMADAAKTEDSHARMGATVAGILVREQYALAFNCGDCRTYRMSCGVLERLTRDHSFVQSLFENGKIDEDGMRKHPKKNVVTSAVSANPPEKPELYARAISRVAEDEYFICSDGVWEALSVSELEGYLGGGFPDSARMLGEALIARGCRDNVSFIWAASLF